MGTGDRKDPTTDFFDTHKAQCVLYAAKLRVMTGTESIVAKMDEAIAACDVAIAKGRRRVDMPVVVVDMPAIVTTYDSLPQKTKDDLRTAIRADVPTKTASTEAKK